MIQKVAFEVSQLEKIAQNRSIKGLDINNEDYDNSDEKNDKFFIELKDTLFDINGNLIVLNLIKIRQSHNAFLQMEYEKKASDIRIPKNMLELANIIENYL
ncbi:hypothetical protein GLOIN_2v1774495 [Rhizophagus irregularis DAOM 181602=DAOM 197198]|nr:hypothetical protein GLOIN_2v1774495 [Rhizophagus irregularis DAOM 181602=DAOM 197198]